MRMRPWETNVINDIKGDDIFVYDMNYYDSKIHILKNNSIISKKYKYIFKINSLREISYIYISLIKERLNKKLFK